MKNITNKPGWNLIDKSRIGFDYPARPKDRFTFTLSEYMDNYGKSRQASRAEIEKLVRIGKSKVTKCKISGRITNIYEPI